jgi:hypothetical protein
VVDSSPPACKHRIQQKLSAQNPSISLQTPKEKIATSEEKLVLTYKLLPYILNP